MLATITVEETQISLKDLIDQVVAGQEIIITRNQQPVVIRRLTNAATADCQGRKRQS